MKRDRDVTGMKAADTMLRNKRVVRTRLTFWGANREHDASETLPTVLWVILAIYVFWFGAFLIAALNNTAIKADGLDLALHVYRAFVGGVAPLFGTYAIGADKVWGQWYIPLSFLMLFSMFALRDFIAGSGPDTATIITFALAATITGLLTFSPVVRNFYAAVKENERAINPRLN